MGAVVRWRAEFFDRRTARFSPATASRILPDRGPSATAPLVRSAAPRTLHETGCGYGALYALQEPPTICLSTYRSSATAFIRSGMEAAPEIAPSAHRLFRSTHNH